MRLAVVGCGYVGLVTGVCLASFGHQVICVDADPFKVKSLRQNQIPFYEPGLAEFCREQFKLGRISFEEDIQSLTDTPVIFVAVGTPSLPAGGQDLSQVWSVLESLLHSIPGDALIVVKSTVSPGTCRKIQNWADRNNRSWTIVHNPEFLREGSALDDSLRPDRVVIGSEALQNERKQQLTDLFQSYGETKVPFVWTGWESAELIKYASNALLASKVAFINEIARLCDEIGADVRQIAAGVGLDQRIGSHFLRPGPGFGGSCFPKDLRALSCLADEHGLWLPLIHSITESNYLHQETMARLIRDKVGVPLAGKKIAILGASFKAYTDDLRESPALTVIDRLLSDQAVLYVYDPKARQGLERKYEDAITYCDTPEKALSGVEAAVILTEWPEIQRIPVDAWRQLPARRLIIDLRNLLAEEAWLREERFEYVGVGIPTPGGTL